MPCIVVKKVRVNIGVKHIHGMVGSRSIFILVSFIIALSIVDSSVVRISAFTGGLSASALNLAAFAALAVVFSVAQQLILSFVKNRYQASTQNVSAWFGRIYKLVALTQYTIIAVFGALILQMTFTSSYNTFFLDVVIWLSYVPCIVLLGFLSQRFLSWFRSNRNTVVLAYSLAMMMISLNAAFTLTYLIYQHQAAGSPVVYPATTPVANYANVYNTIYDGYVMTSILSFILTWFATVLLLRSYSTRLGRVKYWILVGIPLVYFLSQFQFAFVDLFIPLRISDPILFGIVSTLFFNATIPVGGALFGIAFWSVARNIDRDVVKQYMMISAYGMMLLFCSNQAADLRAVPYPPFGLFTASFFGIGSFLLFVGIYFSAISVAQDSELRKSVRGFAIKETRLLDIIGTAQMEREIEQKAIALTKRYQKMMAEETGVQSSLSEDDIKQYVEEVIQEVQKRKTSPGND